MKRYSSYRRICSVCGAIAAVVLVLMLSAKANSSEDWVRVLVNESFFEVPGSRFAVSFVRSEKYVLSAFCWFKYAVGTDAVVLHGRRNADATFWPNVTYEVATEGQTKWKRIAAGVPDQGSDVLTVNPEEPVAKLWVDMAPFRKTVGVYRYGRVVLENGDAAVFAIEDLLPTADARGDTNDFKEIVFESDQDKKKQGFTDAWIAAPAQLLSVISFGDRLIGEFVFEAPSTKPVVLAGSRTPDGDFWPKVTLQVANADHVWKTIGESQNSGAPESLQVPAGKSEKLRVVLTGYTLLIGKFRYGRIMFSNGQFGVFLIDLLNPK